MDWASAVHTGKTKAILNWLCKLARHCSTCWISSLYNEAFDVSMEHTTIVVITCTKSEEILQNKPSSFTAQMNSKWDLGLLPLPAAEWPINSSQTVWRSTVSFFSGSPAAAKAIWSPGKASDHSDVNDLGLFRFLNSACWDDVSVLHLTLNISEIVRVRDLVPKDH